MKTSLSCPKTLPSHVLRVGGAPTDNLCPPQFSKVLTARRRRLEIFWMNYVVSSRAAGVGEWSCGIARPTTPGVAWRSVSELALAVDYVAEVADDLVDPLGSVATQGWYVDTHHSDVPH